MRVSPANLPCRRSASRTRGYCRFWWLLGVLVIAPSFAFADKTFVPLPIFTTDPNERQTYGVLLAVIDAQEGAFRSLLVPTATYNSLLGAAASVHYERYFDRDTKFDTDLAESTRNQAFFRLRYATPTLFDPRYLFRGFSLYEN